MPVKTWTLLDVAKQLSVDEITIAPKDVGGAAKDFLIRKRRLRGGLSEGVDEIRIEQGPFAVSVLPTRSMSLWKAWHNEDEIGWKSPVRGPVHPQFVPLAEPSGLGWLDGFDELLVRCGLESNGAPEFDENQRLKYPLHGRIGNKPAREVHVGVDSDSGEIVVRGVVEETRFHFLKLRLISELRIAPGENGVRIHDTIENISASPAEAQILYHANFGLPLLDGGARIVAPAKTVVPRNERAAADVNRWNSYQAEEAGFEEQVYFLELYADEQGKTQVLLKDAHGTRGVSLHYGVRGLPCFTIWKNTTAAPDGYVTGLEPGTNFPNPRTFEGDQGRVAKLPGGGKASFDLQLAWHPDAPAVEAAEAAIGSLQSKPPQIYPAPQPGWCAS
jgi:hypothetical protein